MKRCPKCRKISGDDWTQCGGVCPIAMSPHYRPDRLPEIAELPPIGSVWKEVDPRFTRHIKVLEHDPKTGKVRICGYAGGREFSPKTWANPKRFNSKRGGYERVA
jgi:hypothetical protein